MTPQQIEAMKLALEALKNNKLTHLYCEDTWYSCPKHEDGCANEAEGDECNCGADEVNAQFDQAITAIEEALAQPEQEPVIDKSAAIRIATSLGWTPQRTWVGMTGLEQKELMAMTARDAVFATEAKLKEKNGV